MKGSSDLRSILRFLPAADLSVTSFHFCFGIAAVPGVTGVEEVPVLFGGGKALLSRSNRFALSSIQPCPDNDNFWEYLRCSFAGHIAFLRDGVEINLTLLAYRAWLEACG